MNNEEAKLLARGLRLLGEQNAEANSELIALRLIVRHILDAQPNASAIRSSVWSEWTSLDPESLDVRGPEGKKVLQAAENHLVRLGCGPKGH